MRPYRNEREMQAHLERAARNGVLTALSKLARAAQRKYRFDDDQELRARLAPMFFQEEVQKRSVWDAVHPAKGREEAIQIMRAMNLPEEIITGGGFIPARDNRHP